MKSRKTVLQRMKKIFTDNPHEKYWNLDDQMVLTFEIEKNGGEHLQVKGTQKTLEYISGILSDNNVPHRNLAKHVNVYTLSQNELMKKINQAYLPFKISYDHHN